MNDDDKNPMPAPGAEAAAPTRPLSGALRTNFIRVTAERFRCPCAFCS